MFFQTFFIFYFQKHSCTNKALWCLNKPMMRLLMQQHPKLWIWAGLVVYCSLLHMMLHSRRPIMVPMLTPLPPPTMGMWASELDYAAMKNGGVVWWLTFSFTSRGWLGASLTSGTHNTRMHYGKKTGRRRQCNALGNVLLGNLGYSLMTVASFSKIMCQITKQKQFRNGLRSATTSLGCSFQIPTISIPSSVCGMCWTHKSDPWRPHLTTYRTLRICC